jgi:hypothetical protein
VCKRTTLFDEQNGHYRVSTRVDGPDSVRLGPVAQLLRPLLKVIEAVDEEGVE